MHSDIYRFLKFNGLTSVFIFVVILFFVLILYFKNLSLSTSINILGLLFEFSAVIWSITFWSYEYPAVIARIESREKKLELTRIYKQERQKGELISDFVKRKMEDKKEEKGKLQFLESLVSKVEIAKEKRKMLTACGWLFVSGTILQMIAVVMNNI